MSVTGAIPTVARDFVSLANSTGREHNRFGPKNFEPATLAIVTERANHAVAVFQQRKDRVLHVHVDALMNAVILQRANHLEPGTIADMRQPGIFMASEISLQNAAVFRAIEHGAPSFELAHAIRRFLRMKLD